MAIEDSKFEVEIAKKKHDDIAADLYVLLLVVLCFVLFLFVSFGVLVCFGSCVSLCVCALLLSECE